MIGIFVGGIFYGVFWGNPFDRDSSSSQVIESIERKEQVVLLSLAIQDIKSDSEDFKVLDLKIPGTTRESHVQYKFDAKLGIEGKDVVIEESGPDEFEITVPEFIFVGYEHLEFSVLHEENGVLSWVTPEIKETEMIAQVLNAGVQQKYLDNNEDLLEEQVVDFYSGIVKSVDPNVNLRFNFK